MKQSAFRQADQDFSNGYLPELRRLIGPHLLVPAPIEQDRTQAVDLIVLRARDMTIGCRIRRADYRGFAGQFTLRSQRDTGTKTELAKIAEGWGDWFFYGFAHPATAGAIQPWWLIDLHVFRFHFIREGFRQKKEIKWDSMSNGDGTYFCWFDIASFPPAPALLVASDPTVPDWA